MTEQKRDIHKGRDRAAIQVTEAMAEAGGEIIAGMDWDGDKPSEDYAEEVFRAMLLAQRVDTSGSA